MSLLLALACRVGLVFASPLDAEAGMQPRPTAEPQAATTEKTPERNTASESDRAAETRQSPPAGETDNEPRDHLTAEDVLRALRRQRPENRLIPPAGTASWSSTLTRPGTSTARRALMPEGTPVINRSGTLTYDGLWWTFVVDNGSDLQPMKLLPNATLEPMVRTVTGTNGRLRFEVSGEVTVFQGENYLLPRVAMRMTDVSAAAAAGPAKAEEPHEPGRTSLETRSKGPAAATGAASEGLEAAPEDVLRLLQAQEPTQRALSMTVLAGEAAPEGRSSAARMLIPDGSPLVERPGRIIRRGNWWTFVFESDHPDHPEPPMKLLPTMGLELMVEAADRGTSGLVFVTSGQVSVFENENYLLPRVVRRRLDSGNLGG